MLKGMDISMRKWKLNGLGKLVVILGLGMMTLCIFFLCAQLIQGPRSITNSRNSGIVKETIDVSHFTVKGTKVEMYYPIFEHADLNNKIDQIRKQIKSEFDFSGQSKVKVDYYQEIFNDQYVSLLFDLSNSDDEIISYRSYLLDLQTNDFVDVSAAFDEVLLKRLTRMLWNELQQVDTMRDVAFSSSFYESIQPDMKHFTQFDLIDHKLSVHILMNQYGDHPEMVLRCDLDEIASHILLDLGVKQTVADAIINPVQRTIDPNRPMIALTFDDGPYEATTSKVVAQLEKYGQSATFYIQGYRVGNNADLILAMIYAGNEIGNHSYNHKNLTKLSDTDLMYQLDETTRIIKQLTDQQYTIATYRPPYGAINDKAKSVSVYPFVLWNVDTLDWKNHDRQQAYDHVMEHVGDGDIVLMHDIYMTTAQAAEQLIPDLIDAGYQLVTVSELMEYKGVSMKAGKIYTGAGEKDNKEGR